MPLTRTKPRRVGAAWDILLGSFHLPLVDHAIFSCTRRTAESVQEGSACAVSEMTDHVDLLRGLYTAFVDLAPGLGGLEGRYGLPLI